MGSECCHLTPRCLQHPFRTGENWAHRCWDYWVLISHSWVLCENHPWPKGFTWFNVMSPSKGSINALIKGTYRTVPLPQWGTAQESPFRTPRRINLRSMLQQHHGSALPCAQSCFFYSPCMCKSQDQSPVNLKHTNLSWESVPDQAKTAHIHNRH